MPSNGTLLGSRVADLNRDGYLDLLFAHRLGDTNYAAIIFWGGQDGYSKERIEEFPLPGLVSFPTLADLDRNGYLDIINADINGRSSIVWGSSQGYAHKDTTFLKTDSSNTSQVADLNGDGRPDLAVANFGSIGSTVEPGNVAALLGNGDGSFQAAGETLRTSLRLFDVRSGADIWGERFDHRVADLFALQDSMFEELSRALHVEPGAQALSGSAARPTAARARTGSALRRRCGSTRHREPARSARPP